MTVCWEPLSLRISHCPEDGRVDGDLGTVQAEIVARRGDVPHGAPRRPDHAPVRPVDEPLVGRRAEDGDLGVAEPGVIGGNRDITRIAERNDLGNAAVVANEPFARRGPERGDVAQPRGWAAACRRDDPHAAQGDDVGGCQARLSLMRSAALRLPDAAGVKRSVNVRAAPGASVSSPLSTSVKSVAFAPVSVTL